MYADDLLMLAISVSDMQKMINICKVELDFLDMKMNAKKSSFLRIGKRNRKDIVSLVIDTTPILKSKEIRYLGIYIESGVTFSCNMHTAKMKYFRSLNGILGKVGTNSPIDVILSLVDSFANPILLYCLETGCLSDRQITKLNYAFRSIYFKLFSTFNISIVEQCQYYTGYLPLNYLIHLRYFIFLSKIQKLPPSPVKFLAQSPAVNRHWVELANLYGITDHDNIGCVKYKIWNKFETSLHLCN